MKKDTRAPGGWLRWILLAWLACGGPRLGAAAPLDPLLGPGDAVWSMTAATWGPQHALKRMKMEDTWTITTGLYIVEPRYTSR